MSKISLQIEKRTHMALLTAIHCVILTHPFKVLSPVTSTNRSEKLFMKQKISLTKTHNGKKMSTGKLSTKASPRVPKNTINFLINGNEYVKMQERRSLPVRRSSCRILDFII